MKNSKVILMMFILAGYMNLCADDQIDQDDMSNLERFVVDVKKSFAADSVGDILTKEDAAQQFVQGLEQLEIKVQKRGLSKGFISGMIADCASLLIEFVDIIPTGLGNIDEEEKNCLGNFLDIINQHSVVCNDKQDRDLFVQKLEQHVSQCRQKNQSFIAKVEAAMENPKIAQESIDKETLDAASELFDTKLKEKNKEFLSLQLRSAMLADAYKSEKEKAFEKALEQN